MFSLFNKQKDRQALINPKTEHKVLIINKGKTLLNSALNSGIDWPHKCKVGSCGTCKCKVLSGDIKPQIDFGYVLSTDEINDGYVLACQSELRSDIEVEINLNNNKDKK
jgi:ferredoxin|tara:strand:+ start:266 stop:592 length:327 start_codon:yes stop_codon:yes gene_type:complete